MITSEKLSSSRIKEIMSSPLSYDKDCPKLSAEQIARMKTVHPKYRKIKPVKVPLSIKIDADVLEWFKAKGKGYQTRINKALREAMINGN